MYAYIKGVVSGIEQNAVIIDVGGIGYRVFTNTFSISSLKKGDEAKMYTRLIIREDEHILYGFATNEEKNMFEKLISVNGVGPKVALSVLSTVRASDIGAAVISSNFAVFESVPGIGKKTAQRLVLELKEKVSMSDAVENYDFAPSNIMEDAAMALMGLGYQRNEAMSALAAVKSLGDTAEDLVLLALKRLGR